MNIKHIYTLLLSAALFSCASDDLTDAKLSKELLNVEKEVELTAMETRREVAVSANCHWEVSVDRATWGDLTVSPLSGDGNGTITLQTGTNTTVSERTAMLTITSADGLKQKISLRQTMGGASLQVTLSELTFEAVPTGSVTFTVISNAPWHIQGLTDWLTIEPMSGDAGSTDVTVTASETQSTESRTQTFVVALDDNSATHSIQATQAGKDKITPTLSVSTTSLAFEAVPATAQSFNVTSNVSWHILTTDDWLKVEPVSGNGAATVNVTADEIQDDRDRYATLTIVSDDETITHHIEVSQAGKTDISLALNPATLNVYEATGGQQTIAVTSNARWYVDMPGNPDWLTVSTAVGVGNDDLVITCLPNYTTEARLIRITVTAGSRNPKEESLRVEQKAGEMPQITTPLSVTDKSSSSASFAFGYTSMFALTDHGICYSTTNATPTVSDTRISLGAGHTAGEAVATLTDLSPSATYHVRAYAISPMEGGTPVYSDVLTFSTLGGTPNIGDNPYPELAPKR